MGEFILEIILEVRKDQVTPFRPPLDVLDVREYILRCIRLCWNEEPDQRPDIRFVRVMLKEMQVFSLDYHLTATFPLILHFLRPV